MKLDHILYIDIETVSAYENFQQMPDSIQSIWTKKYERIEYLNSRTLDEAYESKAAIFAEFGKIICISIGYYHKVNDEYRIKSFAGHNEKDLLLSFSVFCSQLKSNYLFCGHNIKEFDIPYICRRLLIHRISLPAILDFQDKKPWEIHLIDTLQLWKFGDYKNYTSLETLTTIFDIPTPKSDIDGSMVGQIYWKENDLERIVQYCQSDVLAVINLHRAFNQLEIISDEKIKIIC